MLSCTQPVTEITQEKQTTDEAPTTEQESESVEELATDQIEEDILIKPITIYPAYIVEDGGAIYGIPSSAI